MKVKCQRCENEWEYNGEKVELAKKYPQFVSCSKCRTSVKLEVNNDRRKEKEKK